MGRVVVLSLAVVLALLGSACGGSEAGDPDQWAGEAEALCRDLERALGTLEEPRGVDEDELAEFMSATAREVDAWLEAMRKLEPSTGSEAQTERMLELYGRAVRSTERAAEALASGDVGRYRALLRDAEAPSEQADALARALGAESCENPRPG